jgi:glycosyltransferase involved in cell wall biosynthesis
MKIVILQDRLRLGGTEVQALALGQQWLQAGHDVRLIVFRHGGKLAETRIAKRLKVKVLQPLVTWLDMWAPGLEKAVAEIAPDVVVAFGREANAKLPVLQRLPNQPLLVGTLRSGREQPKRFWKGLKVAEVVIANAHWAADAAAQNGIARDKLQTIYSGPARKMEVPDPAASRAEWRKQTQTPKGVVVLLCVAAFRLGKGQQVLLHAMSKLPVELDWRLWFAGDGLTLKQCKNLAEQLYIADRVSFLGMVEDPSPLYAAADVAVLTSLAEALPNFLIEAQLAGLPVVATTVGGVPECFVEGQTGLGAPDGEMDKLVEALTRAISDEDWRKAAREPAQARANELFNAERNGARWLEVFASLQSVKR